MATITALVLGIGLGVLLGWLALNGLLVLAFRRARTMIRRMAERRQASRVDAPDRRHLERRTQ